MKKPCRVQNKNEPYLSPCPFRRTTYRGRCKETAVSRCAKFALRPRHVERRTPTVLASRSAMRPTMTAKLTCNPQIRLTIKETKEPRHKPVKLSPKVNCPILWVKLAWIVP